MQSGYCATLLPLYIPTRAPRTTEQVTIPVIEPFYVTLSPFLSLKTPPRDEHKGGTYITSWFVAQIPPDAAIDSEHTYLEGESSFETHLLAFDDALGKLEEQAPTGSPEAKTELLVVRKAIELWKRMKDIEEGRETLEIAKDIGSSKIDRKYWE
ncbi:hypothetical protein AURDEDRAFT_125824 [Auricularia subglabra TFB-10046 SS5]|nr:hypothetical protein AURDEDRAFT_125824 [Auricularia subglabra TFB-10046 SS5]